MELTTLNLARQIPKKYRDMILEGNIVYKAVATSTDTHMKMLFIIWKNHVEPNNTNLDMDCGFCLSNILEGFTSMQPALIELSKEDKLLDL